MNQITVHVDSGNNLALIVSGLSLLVAAIALIWQFTTWRLSSSRVTASLRWGSSNQGQLLTMPPSSEYPAAMIEQLGGGKPMIVAEVRNVGRAVAFIDDYRVRFANGGECGYVPGSGRMAGLPDLPIRLEPGASVKVFVDLELAWQNVAVYYGMGKIKHAAMNARMVLQLGDGRRVRTRKSVLVQAPQDLADKAKKVAEAALASGSQQ